MKRARHLFSRLAIFAIIALVVGVTLRYAYGAPGKDDSLGNDNASSEGQTTPAFNMSTCVFKARRVTGPVEGSFFPILPGEHFEKEAFFWLKLDVGTQTAPPNLKWQLREGETVLQPSQGEYSTGTHWMTFFKADATQYLRCYVDGDGDGLWDQGESMKDSPAFWVQYRKVYHFVVDYSNRLPPLTKDSVQADYDESAFVGLRKDNANDYRACVRFVIDTLTRIPSTNVRYNVDPTDTFKKRMLHYQAASDMDLVHDIDGGHGAGVTNCKDIHQIIIDWDSKNEATIIHEIGHGCGLQDVGTIGNIMHSSYIFGDNALTHTQADPYGQW